MVVVELIQAAPKKSSTNIVQIIVIKCKIGQIAINLYWNL